MRQLELADAALAVGAGVAPAAAPKNSTSSRVSGMAATLTVTSGLSARPEAPWIACASSSLPVPVSPSSSTGASSGAARAPGA